MKKLVTSTLNKFGLEVRRTTPRYLEEVYHQHYSKDSIENKRFYNIGAGSFYHPYWRNIEYFSDWYQQNADNIHISYDLFSKEPLPIESDTAEIFYSSHTFEHIDNESAQYVFNEAYRSLKPGGLFRIVVPHADRFFQAYAKNDLSFFTQFQGGYIRGEKLKEATLAQRFIFEIATITSKIHTDTTIEKVSDQQLAQLIEAKGPEGAMDELCSRCSIELQRKHAGNHINWWNPNKFQDFLQKAGFSEVFHCSYGQSLSPVMRNLHLFDWRPFLSLYVEAVK